MDARILPDAIEPTYWNVVFWPSESRLARIFVGRFKHVSAFTYIAGFRAWLMFDNQWGGTRISLFAHPHAFVPALHGTTIVKVDRAFAPIAISSRLGTYCVPAVKQLLGLSCVAATPTGLYRYLIKHGGSVIGERIGAANSAGSVPAAGAAASAE
jgi:hypothetical protein